MWQQSATYVLLEIPGCAASLINSAATMGLQRPSAALLQRASLGCGPRGNAALLRDKTPRVGSTQLGMLSYDVRCSC
eukprot:6208618-Pleurochrysis_carterae.AAC.1